MITSKSQKLATTTSTVATTAAAADEAKNRLATAAASAASMLVAPQRKRKRSYSCSLDTSNFFFNGGFDGFKSLLTGKFSLSVGFKRARSSASFSDETDDVSPLTPATVQHLLALTESSADQSCNGYLVAMPDDDNEADNGFRSPPRISTAERPDQDHDQNDNGDDDDDDDNATSSNFSATSENRQPVVVI